MTAGDYQRAARARLQRHFADVRLEWSVVAEAQDAFEADIHRYAPRVDIAVGPFNTTPGRDPAIRAELLPEALRDALSGRPSNPNPRCLLAIEVVFSGSSKHLMGDPLNAGAHGLYGLVVGSEALIPKIRRIAAYLELLARLEKLPPMFLNVLPLSTAELDALVGGE